MSKSFSAFDQYDQGLNRRSYRAVERFKRRVIGWCVSVALVLILALVAWMISVEVRLEARVQEAERQMVKQMERSQKGL